VKGYRIPEGKTTREQVIEIEPLYRLRYIPHEAKRWAHSWVQNYANHTWGSQEDFETAPDFNELRDRVTIHPYDDGVPHNIPFFIAAQRRLQQSYERVATSIIEDTMRRTIREAVLHAGGMQFGGSSGGVYFIPDPSKDAPYMEWLLPFSQLVNWFGEETRPNANTGSRYRDESGEIVPYYAARTTFRVLGYIDSPQQVEYLRADITNSLGSLIAEYYENVLEKLNEADPDEREAFDETLEVLLRQKREIQTRMTVLQATLGDEAAEVRLNPFSDIEEGLDARLMSITSENTRAGARVQQLLEFGDDALLGASEEEE